MTLRDFEPRPVSKRKNTKQWCKGKVGREHRLAVVFDERMNNRGSAWEKCRSYSYKQRIRVQQEDGSWAFEYVLDEKGEQVYSEERWICYHIEVCLECGRHFDFAPTCPDKPENIKQYTF